MKYFILLIIVTIACAASIEKRDKTKESAENDVVQSDYVEKIPLSHDYRLTKAEWKKKHPPKKQPATTPSTVSSSKESSESSSSEEKSEEEKDDSKSKEKDITESSKSNTESDIVSTTIAATLEITTIGSSTEKIKELSSVTQSSDCTEINATCPMTTESTADITTLPSVAPSVETSSTTEKIEELLKLTTQASIEVPTTQTEVPVSVPVLLNDKPNKIQAIRIPITIPIEIPNNAEQINEMPPNQENEQIGITTTEPPPMNAEQFIPNDIAELMKMTNQRVHFPPPKLN